MVEDKKLPVISGWKNIILSRPRFAGSIYLLWGALLVAPLLTGDAYTRHILIVSLLFGAQAMVSDFTIGFINITNFGIAAFVGLGAYTSALFATELGVHPLLGLLAGAIVSGIVGFFTGLLTLRLRGIFVAIMAWFVALALEASAAALVDLTRGHLGLFVPPLLENTLSRLPYYYILLVIVFGIYAASKIIVNSHIGLAFKAIGQDLDYARASGINPTRYKLIAFTLSCAFAGLLGGFLGHFVGILTPDVMGTEHTVEIIALNIIGGRGSIWGPLLVGFVTIPIFESLKFLLELRLVIFGSLLLAVIILYPAGLAGMIRALGAWIKSRFSS